jgi:DNA-directed RNA polymerase subunit beta'
MVIGFGIGLGVFRRVAVVAFCVVFAVFGFAGCGGKEKAVEPVGELTSELSQYYVNENFMVEMLVNEYCTIRENGANLTISMTDGHAGIVLSLLPGIQNLSAAGELSMVAVQNAFQGVEISGISDANLFGARAKKCEYQLVGEDGNIELMGIEAAGIVNQSCYFLNVMMEPGMSEAEGALIVGVFSSMNVLRPSLVDQGEKEAVYTSHYQEQLDSKAVKRAPQAKAKAVNEWKYLPYYYYSGWGDPGDYAYCEQWYFEPDWDYYSDPGDYWDWGWDEDSEWWFYDEYSDYYDYDYYQDYDDYWDDYDPYSDYGDTYDEWGDSGDMYDEWGDTGDMYDEWGDTGDYYDEDW